VDDDVKREEVEDGVVAPTCVPHFVRVRGVKDLGMWKDVTGDDVKRGSKERCFKPVHWRFRVPIVVYRPSNYFYI